MSDKTRTVAPAVLFLCAAVVALVLCRQNNAGVVTALDADSGVLIVTVGKAGAASCVLALDAEWLATPRRHFSDKPLA